MDSNSEPELKLISLISQILSLNGTTLLDPEQQSKLLSLVIQIIHLVRSMDLDSVPKPESKLMSLVTQTIYVFNSMDLDCQPRPLSKLISLITQKISLLNSEALESQLDYVPEYEFMSLVSNTWILEPEPELISLSYQILSLIISRNSKWKKLSPQVEVRLEKGKLHLKAEIAWSSSNNNKWHCLPLYWTKFKFRGEEASHFHCLGCNGEDHNEFDKAPIKVKHPLHPKHYLQLVILRNKEITRECYCCDESLKSICYYCLACDYAMNVACVEKAPLLSIDHPKWHEHSLALFPSQASFPCNLCALADSTSCPFYICPPCDFVVHQSCISLPHVIRISRHPHRISFTPSFDQGDLFCGVCRRKIENDYGGYSCIKEGCSYAAHSKCATQSNVWDGVELEGQPEDIEEEGIEPFVRISNGIIQHFSHQHHHLRLDENTCRDFDENKQCQACIMPIYFGNFYSCLQCDFILHETCANLSRKMHHPIHPHLLTLVGGNDSVIDMWGLCSACDWFCTAGFSYNCGKEGCFFKIHLQCATISEPLVHGSHIHPLFLTSKPGEERICSVCGGQGLSSIEVGVFPRNDTFNCIECDFSLCFACATTPEKVRYKHDKHMLTLSYGEETSTMTYWCEVCERKINPKGRFYRCNEYCCVTIHIKCLFGVDFYMKPGSSCIRIDRKLDVMRNNHMSRPICYRCHQRCKHKVFFIISGSIACSLGCTW